MPRKVYKISYMKVKQNNDRVYFPVIFEKINCLVNDIRYKFDYNYRKYVSISIESNLLDNSKLDYYFFYLYNYICMIIGYYPKILSGLEFDINEVAEEYNTGNRYIRNSSQFLDSLDNESFSYSYSNFLEVMKTLSFPIHYYGIVISEHKQDYPEIVISNLLQCLDGIYDELSITQNDRFIYKKKVVKKIKERITSIDISDIVDAESLLNIKDYISDSICRLEYINYETKLRFIFNHIDEKCNLFEAEKNSNFDIFIKKCKNTRNKLSHISEKNDCFNNTEAVLYIEKLVLVFRMLILEEIGLQNNINASLLKKEIQSIDDWILKRMTIFKCFEQ